ncbi:MAG: ATP-grasp domain-containing protein [Pseudonocardiaceae bacterium]
MSGPARPGLLLVDDRPTSFSRYVVGRADIDVVLLRFEQVRHELPASYLEDTAHLRSFWVRSDVPLDQEARRYRSWVRSSPGTTAPEFFCNPSEPRQALAHRFAGMTGLPHLDEQQVSWVRNKVAMKDRFRKLGLSTAEYARIHDRAEVLEFAAEHGWPVVLKPVDSFACIDTFLVRDAAELRDVELPDRSWMVESYLGGVEGENCALVVGGEVLDVWPSTMPARPLDIVAGSINANISVATGEGAPAGLHELTQRIVTGMGLDHGYVHMEFFVEGEQLRVGEIGLRVAGCEITANHGYAYGFDVFGAVLDVYLGRRPELRYRHRRCAGDLLLPLPSSGLVRKITDAEELLAMPGVVVAVLRVGPGDLVTCRRASHNASGYVHVVGASVAEVEQRMRRILTGFTIEIESPADTVAMLP